MVARDIQMITHNKLCVLWCVFNGEHLHIFSAGVAVECELSKYCNCSFCTLLLYHHNNRPALLSLRTMTVKEPGGKQILVSYLIHGVRACHAVNPLGKAGFRVGLLLITTR